MTVIAYRDGVMAGDSCWSDDNHAGLIFNLQNKIFVLRSGALYGSAGGSDDRELKAALEDVVAPEMFPSCKDLANMEDGNVDALLVLPDGAVWRVHTGETMGGVEPISLPFASVGCGQGIAVGAMAAGKSAFEAVKIVCDYNIACRPPVHTIKLKR